MFLPVTKYLVVEKLDSTRAWPWGREALIFTNLFGSAGGAEISFNFLENVSPEAIIQRWKTT